MTGSSKGSSANTQTEHPLIYISCEAEKAMRAIKIFTLRVLFHCDQQMPPYLPLTAIGNWAIGSSGKRARTTQRAAGNANAFD
jgi:hypothetical protein